MPQADVQVSLVPATEAAVLGLMAWCPDARSCQVWGGPQFRHPFTAETFVADTRCRDLPSFVLQDEAGTVVAFGQYYLRAGRCHFGRLVVSPAMRGRGLGTQLIRGLAREGVSRLGVEECSLFVVPDNLDAMRLYERLGFVVAEYPEDDPDVRPFTYMVAPASALVP